MHAAGAELLVSAGAGSPEEIEALAPYHPEWLFADDPALVREAFAETVSADQPEK